MTTREVSEYLRVPVSTLYRWRYVGTGPPSIKVGRHKRYRREAVTAWLKEQERR
jgi:excisionase family DNA binding protein